MSDLTVAVTAEILASDVGLHFTIVRWTPPVVSAARPTAPLRRAVAMLNAHGGGLLVAHVVRDGLGRPPQPSAARAALATALRDAPVVELHALPCADGLAVVARVAPTTVAWIPADLEPVDGADVSDLRATAASRIASVVTRRAIAEVDEALGADERLLVAAGALAVVDGDLVPTVGGLVALGRAPWEHLGGLRVDVDDRGREIVVVGDGPTLPQRVVRALRIPEPNAEVVRALVERALIERAWSPHVEDEALLVRRHGHEVEVRWPPADGDGVPNRTLRRLLRTVGGLGQLAENLVRIADRVEALGGVWIGEEAEDGDTVVRVELPEVDVVEETEEEPPRPHARPHHEVPDRVLVEKPLVIAEPAPSRPAPPVISVAPAPTTIAPAHTTPHVSATHREAAVLALVDALGQVTTRDVIEQLGWTRSTTRDVLARMVAAGRIVSVATSARSPFQAYVRCDHG